jgi:hypothetical protein
MQGVKPIETSKIKEKFIERDWSQVQLMGGTKAKKILG